MNNTLYKKNCNSGDVSKLYPITTIDNVIDLDTNESINDILEKYNHIWLPFKGNSKALTRQQVPPKLRRRGLWITYISCKNKTTTEWYDKDDFSDRAWGDSANWVQPIDIDTLKGEVKNVLTWYKA